VKLGAVEIDQVHAHLGATRAGEPQTQRLHTRQAAAGFAHGGRNGARHLGIVCGEDDIERDQRLSRTDEYRPGAGFEHARAEVRLELAGVDAQLELLGTSAAEECRASPATDLPVEEHRQSELGAHPLPEDAGGLARTLHVFRPDRHERHDIGGTHAGMHTVVEPKIDGVPRCCDPCNEGVDEKVVAFRADKREHRPVVVGVRMNVEQSRVRGKSISDNTDNVPVTAFRDIRDRFEREHARTLRTVKEYYDRRAPEYDDWWLGEGLYAPVPAGWSEERDELMTALEALGPKRTLDVACGTGFVTNRLRGEIVGLDHSETMLRMAERRNPGKDFVQGDAFALPFPDNAFERVFSSHFYGHLEDGQRLQFLAEARRVAPELVIVDAALHGKDPRSEWQERVLKDGSRWTVFKRFFDPASLVSELEGGEIVHAGRWFVAVRSLARPAVAHHDAA
jgi:ubiquinone/menaquinone biosynthesis C-methylase UbiE